MNSKYFECFDSELRLKLNKLAREQVKLKLLSDIRIDQEICKIERLEL